MLSDPDCRNVSVQLSPFERTFQPSNQNPHSGLQSRYRGELVLNRTAWREGTMRVFELLGILGLLVLVYVVSGRPD
jgi:hypothetical protein